MRYCQYLLLLVGVVSEVPDEWWVGLDVDESTRSRRDIRNLDRGDVFDAKIGRLVIDAEVGEGAFGVVYGAHVESDTSIGLAIKVQKQEIPSHRFLPGAPKDFGNLDHEVRVLQAMQGVEGFPTLFAFQLSGRYKYMVTELLGTNLLRRRNVRQSYLGKIGAQIVQRFRELHKRGFLMNDVHRGNFVEDEDDKIFVIDLGLAIPWRGVKETDYAVRTSDGRRKYFTSRREDIDKSQSRRDDVEKLLYMLVNMAGGELPWARYVLSSMIVDVKRHATAAEICTGKAQWLQPAMEHILSLKFDDEPDYDYLIQSLLA